MSLYELGQEYEKHIEMQDFFIDKCKADIQKARMIGDSDALKTLQGNLRRFYEIKEDLELTASMLKNYYKGEN
jgi:hypothetical protein